MSLTCAMLCVEEFQRQRWWTSVLMSHLFSLTATTFFAVRAQKDTNTIVFLHKTHEPGCPKIYLFWTLQAKCSSHHHKWRPRVECRLLRMHRWTMSRCIVGHLSNKWLTISPCHHTKQKIEHTRHPIVVCLSQCLICDSWLAMHNLTQLLQDRKMQIVFLHSSIKPHKGTVW